MKSLKIFRIFGIDIKLHYSWWIVFVLLAWILTTNFFPAFFPEQTSQQYWLMGILASLLLFVSVLLHELAHALVAKSRKIKVESITLFFFGGVAGITSEDMKPSSEFLMAIAGPIFSIVLAALFFLLFKLDGNITLTAISFYLYQLNFILAIFNLIPGYPLDGGRAFRAILYWHYKDLKKATLIASKGGKIFAGVLIILGILGMISGQGSGIWFILLGGFIYFIAGTSYEQVVIKEVLDKVKVKELLQKKIPTVKGKMNLNQLVEKYKDTEHTVFLVKGKGFKGILDTKAIDKASLRMQKMMKLQDLALSLSSVKSIQDDENCYKAFVKLAKEKYTLLPVKKGKKHIGFIGQKVLMHHLVWELKFGHLAKRKKLKKVKKGK